MFLQSPHCISTLFPLTFFFKLKTSLSLYSQTPQSMWAGKGRALPLSPSALGLSPHMRTQSHGSCLPSELVLPSWGASPEGPSILLTFSAHLP